MPTRTSTSSSTRTSSRTSTSTSRPARKSTKQGTKPAAKRVAKRATKPQRTGAARTSRGSAVTSAPPATRTSAAPRATAAPRAKTVADLARERQPMPAFVRTALRERKLTAAYRARPPYQQNDYLMWINAAKQEPTRQKRLTQMLDELAGGTRYMRMAWRPGERATSRG